jgi:hypothetical protein
MGQLPYRLLPDHDPGEPCLCMLASLPACGSRGSSAGPDALPADSAAVVIERIRRETRMETPGGASWQAAAGGEREAKGSGVSIGRLGNWSIEERRMMKSWQQATGSGQRAEDSLLSLPSY